MATIQWWRPALWACVCSFVCGAAVAQQAHSLGSRTIQRAQQRSRGFLAQRGVFTRGQSPAQLLAQARLQDKHPAPNDISGTGAAAAWTSVGPSAIQTAAFGLVSGRVTSIAVDPADTSGNTVYVGTTGGGVWKSTNAAGPQGSVTFTPLTDTLPTSANCTRPVVSSLSIGALTVQPGGTGVILAGTGDPNDALDSYYGEGVLRSTDGGQTWCTISQAADNLLRTYSFVGEGFAGFAWSTQNIGLVVAAVAKSAVGFAVKAESMSAGSFAGLYYSQDAGLTWHLATITDGPGMDIQRPDRYFPGTGNSATSVTWNPVRQRFYAAVRYHGYYESTDGITWTRLQNQPGTGLYQAVCPANPNSTGSTQCPIFRGTVVSQPATGDLFAITVDSGNADQGLWRDVCNSNNGNCASSTVTFSQRIDDAQIETGGGIPQGDYTLSLAAVPARVDTLLFVGTKDIYRCSLLNNCIWRNTTNTDTCKSGQVAPSQHAIEATFGGNGLMYFGTDGGLWRTTDAVSQQQSVCSSDDASHFQNLNSGLGPISEVGTFSVDPQNPDVMMAALGGFGTAALSGSGTSWTLALPGEGDNNEIDPQNSQNWYATSAPTGSSPFIESCSSGSACATSGQWNAAIGSGQIGNDLTGPIVPWILDPQNPANIIIGTCRVWRGLASGQSWTQGNLLGNPLDNDRQNSYCNGNALIRSLAASGGSGNTEIIYAGMAGSADGGASVAGHLYSAIVPAPGGLVAWNDLTQSPIINGQGSTFNAGGFDISSIYVDPHDASGNTVYVTRQGFITPGVYGALVYRSVDGGAHWISLATNLPDVPANSILVDPNDANTVYVATDIGVYATRNIISCTNTSNPCWAPLGSGLPFAPVTQLRYVSSGSTQVLLASTYGRGIWQVPLLTSGAQPTTATLTPPSLTFTGQTQNTVSSPQTMTVTNTGPISLSITSISAGQDFLENDNCSQPVAPGSTCNIQVSFAPQKVGAVQSTLTVFGNFPGGQITAALSGTGLAPGNVQVVPGSLNFGNAIVGKTTPAQNVTVSNTGGTSVNLQQPAITGDFQIIANTCGTALPSDTGCTIAIAFSPAASGIRNGTFSIGNGSSMQTVMLTGNGQTPATAQLSATSLNFSTPVTVGTVSSPQTTTLTNTGDAALAQIEVMPGGDFLVQNNCPALLPGHASCPLVVTFAPKQVGAETGSLTISTALGMQMVALSGTGLAPAGVSLLPASINFGGQGVTVTSSKHSVTLTNNGGVPLTGLSFAVTGTGFAIAGSTCQSGRTLAVGSACMFDLTFTPTQTQSRTGALMVNATQLSAPYTVPLSGTGEDFNISVVGKTSQVIVNGQSAAYQVQITSVDGSSGPVQVSCSGLPQNATCASGLAAGAMLTGSASMTATVTIATGVSTSAAIRWPQTMAMAFALLPCIFISRKRKYLLRLWMMCIVSLVLLVSTACGTSASGGSGSAPGTPTGSTPSNTYTININATLDGLTKSAAVQLTVQ
jgi:hypothetical protein